MNRRARETLAANLTSLMSARAGLDTFKKIVAAGGPSNGTLDRIRRKESGCVRRRGNSSSPICRGESDAEKALWRKVDGLMRELGELRSEAQTGPASFPTRSSSPNTRLAQSDSLIRD